MPCDDIHHEQNGDRIANSFPGNLIAYSSTRVVSLGRPILAVAHDHHGEWQVLHGDLMADDQIAHICMACAVKRDSSLMGLSDLPCGWIATRKSRHKRWKREQLEKPDDPIWVRILSFIFSLFRGKPSQDYLHLHEETQLPSGSEVRR